MELINQEPQNLKDGQNSNQKKGENSDVNKFDDSDMEFNISTIPLKITLVGNSSVGKTSIIIRFCDKKFENRYSATISVSYKVKKLKIDNFTEAELKIWDTVGHEKYHSITKNFLRDSNGILLVFDLTDEKSFKDLDIWMKEIKDVIEENKVEKILVGNKSDLSANKISDDLITNYANKNNMKYLAVSAKEGINIESLFEMISIGCVKRIQEQQKEGDEEKEKEIQSGERSSTLSGQFKNDFDDDSTLRKEIKANDKKQVENKNKKCC